MAGMEVPQGPWHKAFDEDSEGPRVAFDVDRDGRRFAYRPRELLLLRKADPPGDIELFLRSLWGDLIGSRNPLVNTLATQVAVCALTDAIAGGARSGPLTLGNEDDPWANLEAINRARVVRIEFTQELLDWSAFPGLTMPEIVEAFDGQTIGGFSASINTVFFSAHRRLFGNPVMWSGVGGAPVMWSSVDGTPVMWSGVGGAPVMWSGELGGAPVMWSAVDGTPVMWSGVDGQPVMWSSELGATPVMWSGASWGMHGNGNCCCCCDDDFEPVELAPEENLFTSARAALDPGFAPRRGEPATAAYERGEGRCLVVILDTGLDDAARIPHVSKISELNDNDDPFNVDNDLFVDPAAGHGTFIAGLIRRLAPEANILVGRVLSSFGDGSECVVSAVVRHLVELGPGILNLSFVGYYPNDEPPPVLEDAINELVEAGWIVVAAAGNDATCRKAYPAAMDNVIGVGALAPWGPAWFTNYGDWVDACAPGFDIVSNWYDFKGLGSDSAIDGTEKSQSGNKTGVADRDVGTLKRNGDDAAADAHGWAAWSGTSFSAPIVTAALANDVISAGWHPVNDVGQLRKDREAIVNDPALNRSEKTDALIALEPSPLPDNDLEKTKEVLQQARMRVIDDWRLARVPCLGTIVNDHL